MKVHNFKFDPNRKIDKRGITHHPLGHGCQIIKLDRDEDLFFAEAVIIDGVFVGMCTVSRTPDKQPREWSMIFNELNRKDLRVIKDRFKYCAPLIMLPYIESTSIPCGDWPKIYNNRALRYCLNQEPGQEKIEVIRHSGKLDYELIFTL